MIIAWVGHDLGMGMGMDMDMGSIYWGHFSFFFLFFFFQHLTWRYINQSIWKGRQGIFLLFSSCVSVFGVGMLGACYV